MLARSTETRKFVRQLCVSAAIVGCSGSDAPTAPTPPPAAPVLIAARASGATWAPFFEGRMTATIANEGDAGAWRWVAWEDLSDCNETPGCARRLAVQCVGPSTPIAARGTAALAVDCQTPEGFRWVVLEVAAGSEWVRTACLPRPGNTCPAALIPTR